MAASTLPAAGGSQVSGIGFVFHDVAAGGIEGDATLEWFFLAPGPTAPGHSSFFWGRDSSRYNIFWGADSTGAPDSDRFVSGDFFNGSNFPISSNGHNTQFPLTLDEWHHVAIVRTALGAVGDSDSRWEWYFDGVLNDLQTVETFAPLPTAANWTINGRGAPFTFPGFMDEIRGVSRALTPDEFLMSPSDCEPVAEVCDDGADNDCDGAVDGDDSDCQGVGPFLRGDCDGNGVLGGSPTEAIVLLNFAFRGAAAPPCVAACDAEANGAIGVTDALRILRFAFLGIGVPDAPFPDCVKSALGTDVELGCENPICAP